MISNWRQIQIFELTNKNCIKSRLFFTLKDENFDKFLFQSWNFDYFYLKKHNFDLKPEILMIFYLKKQIFGQILTLKDENFDKFLFQSWNFDYFERNKHNFDNFWFKKKQNLSLNPKCWWFFTLKKQNVDKTLTFAVKPNEWALKRVQLDGTV